MTKKQQRPDYYSIDMLSTSRLKLFMEYPPLKAWHLAYQEVKETDALIMGRATHSSFLTPDEFADEFVFLPDDYNGRTKEGKALKQEIIDSGRLPLDKKQKETINGICNRLLSNKNVMALNNGEAELEFFGKMKCGKDLIDYKGKFDMINKKKKYISDLKTTLDATPEKAVIECINRGYFMQMVAYTELARQNGIEINKCFLIFVEKNPPFSCSIIEMSDVQRQIGQAQLDHALALYDFALKNPEYDYCDFPMGQKHFQYDTKDYLVRKYLGDNEE